MLRMIAFLLVTIWASTANAEISAFRSLPLSQHTTNGWWTHEAPSAFYLNRDYSSSLVALSGPNCGSVSLNVDRGKEKWAAARGRCLEQGELRGIHLLLNFTPGNDILDDLGAEAIRTNRYWHQQWSGIRDRVRSYDVATLSDVEAVHLRLLESCEVVESLLWNAEGTVQGQVATHSGGPSGMTVFPFFSELLPHVAQPCILSPHARVQVTACNVAQNPEIQRSILRQMQRHYGSENWSTGSGVAPFYDLRILVNRGLGITAGIPGVFSAITYWGEDPLEFYFQ